MRIWPVCSCFSVLLLPVVLCGELHGQTTTSGALAGVITDPSKAVVAARGC